MTPDVNVLVAAFRADHPHHPVALAWLQRARVACAEGQASLCVLPMVLTSFLRLTTNPRVFADPDTIDDALNFVERLLATPGVELASCGDEWPLLHNRLRGSTLAGNQIPDAWLAACVERLGEHLVTFDRDFRRLLQLRSHTLLN